MTRPTDLTLPDGTDFAAWGLDWQPGKTLWVDGSHPRAGDDQAGTREAPLRSIARAAALVDGNIVWGSTAHGIKVADCDHQRIEHNLVACCCKNGIICKHNPKREVLGRPATSVGHRVTGNRAFACERPFVIEGALQSEGNRTIEQAEMLDLVLSVGGPPLLRKTS